MSSFTALIERIFTLNDNLSNSENDSTAASTRQLSTQHWKVLMKNCITASHFFPIIMAELAICRSECFAISDFRPTALDEAISKLKRIFIDKLCDCWVSGTRLHVLPNTHLSFLESSIFYLHQNWVIEMKEDGVDNPHQMDGQLTEPSGCTMMTNLFAKFQKHFIRALFQLFAMVDATNNRGFDNQVWNARRMWI